MTPHRKSRIGRKRWGPLVKFLTDTMMHSTDHKTRMTAAQRLTDILLAREQRDQLELKRELRMLEKEAKAPPADEQKPESVDEFLARIRSEQERGSIITRGNE